MKKEPEDSPTLTREHERLQQTGIGVPPWRRWGPFVSERAWGTVREDYSPNGDAWRHLTHEMSRAKAYRWGEDGLAGICDRYQFIVFAIALWNERDPILKERAFGLVPYEGNHGEDEGVLFLSRLDADPLLHEVSLQVPAARVPLPPVDRRESAARRARLRVRAIGHGHL